MTPALLVLLLLLLLVAAAATAVAAAAAVSMVAVEPVEPVAEGMVTQGLTAVGVMAESPLVLLLLLL